MVRLFLEAAAAFDRPDWIEVARDTIAFVHQTLADPADGRFFASQAADEGFYQLPSAALRRTFTPPHVDRTLFTDWTAQAASVWILAGERLGDPSLSEFGGRALDRAVVAFVPSGRGAGALRGRARRHARPADRPGARRPRAAGSARGHGQPDVVDDGRGADAHGGPHAVG